tara:strand:- start:56 stop:229 length:174 start_codon:yes stop_codon:yes gene_type:complete
MKTEIEIKEELSKVKKDIADTKKFLKDEVEFRVDEDLALEDLFYLEKKKKLLEWVLN